MTTYQAVIEHPADLNIFETYENGDYVVGNEVFMVLATLRTQFPEGKFPGTRPVNGKRLTHALIDIDSDDPAQEIDDLLSMFHLQWSLVGVSSVHQYPEYDDQGDPVLDDDGYQVYSQIIDRAIPEALLLQYMQDEYDESDPPVASRPAVAAVTHTWDGCEPVAIA